MEETTKTTSPEPVATDKGEQTENIINDDPEQGKAYPALDDYYLINPFFYEIANYFGVDKKDFDVAKDKLSVIVDYITQEYETKKPEEILIKIRELEDGIMRPQWGESRYANLYKYVRLASQRRAVSRAMSAFERKEKNNVNG